jgi:Ser/Thr protein kinase RdoA (MazF antagonist)
MVDVKTPTQLLAEAGLVDTGRTLPSREATSWLVRHESGLAVLRRLDPALFRPDLSVVRRDLAWLHDYLDRLAATGFPAPHPVAALDGASWLCRDDALWELVSYLPGRIVGWDARPSMEEIGELLARYHDAAAATPRPAQRPVAYPLDTLPTRAAGGEIRGWLDALAADLAAIGHNNAHRHVIHGDFTAHNVLADGDPPVPVGVIDFALSYVDVLWADIGFGLWRSGRQQQRAIGLDLDRVCRLVTGYCRRRPLPPQAAPAIAVYVRARGLQQAVKGSDRGHSPRPRLVARVRWLAEHRTILEDRLASAIARARSTMAGRHPTPRGRPTGTHDPGAEHEAQLGSTDGPDIGERL